jgi:hypothetical protein
MKTYPAIDLFLQSHLVQRNSHIFFTDANFLDTYGVPPP